MTLVYTVFSDCCDNTCTRRHKRGEPFTVMRRRTKDKDVAERTREIWNSRNAYIVTEDVPGFKADEIVRIFIPARPFAERHTVGKPMA